MAILKYLLLVFLFFSLYEPLVLADQILGESSVSLTLHIEVVGDNQASSFSPKTPEELEEVYASPSLQMRRAVPYLLLLISSLIGMVFVWKKI